MRQFPGAEKIRIESLIKVPAHGGRSPKYRQTQAPHAPSAPAAWDSDPCRAVRFELRAVPGSLKGSLGHPFG